MSKRYIDADKLMADLEPIIKSVEHKNRNIKSNVLKCIGIIAVQPDVDVRENVRAVKVIHEQGMTHFYTCGSCGNAIDMEDAYCRHCGAVLIAGDLSHA